MKKALVLGIAAIFAFSFASNANAQNKKEVKTKATTEVKSEQKVVNEDVNNEAAVSRTTDPKGKTANKEVKEVKAPQEKVLDGRTTQPDKNGTLKSAKKESTTKTTLKKNEKDLTGKDLKKESGKTTVKQEGTSTTSKAVNTSKAVTTTKKDPNLNKTVPPTKDPKTVTGKGTETGKNIK